jgi:hypothetical protein
MGADASRIVTVLNCMLNNTSMAGVDAYHWQVNSPQLIHSHVAVGPVSSRISLSFDLANAATVSGSEGYDAPLYD